MARKKHDVSKNTLLANRSLINWYIKAAKKSGNHNQLQSLRRQRKQVQSMLRSAR